MSVTVHKPQSLWISAIVAAWLCTASAPASADVLIDYWADQLTQGPSGPTYHELRNEFYNKIEKSRAAVNACGDCADAQAELDALLQEEEQFQSMASRALTMTGQPPGMFKFLGIRPPSFGDYAASFPTSYQLGEGIVDTNPDWLKDAPEFCKDPVRSHLAKLRTYQDRAQSSNIDFLKTPGGEYYEESRILRACFEKDYEEFARLAELRKARAAGQILPEVEPVGLFNRREKGTIYYGDVPDDFMPPMPPPDVIKQSIAEGGYREIRFIANKKKNDQLTSAIIFPFSGAWLSGRSTEGCRVAYAERQEGAKRHCDDVQEIHRFKPLLLQCNYRTTGRFEMMGRRYELFWYGERAEITKTEYLLQRDHNHPLLVFPDARSSCPVTWQEATAALEAYRASLQRQRGQIAETPMSRSLPRSEWMLERIAAHRRAAERMQERMKVTDAYELPGYYALDYEPPPPPPRGRDTGRGAGPKQRSGVPTIVWAEDPVSADCVIAKDPSSTGPIDKAACWTESQVTIGRTRQLNGVNLSLAFVPTNRFLLDEDQTGVLRSEHRKGNMTLRRKRDLVRFADYPLEGDYLLHLAFGGEFLRAHCTFDSSGGRDTYFRLNCIDDQGRNLQSSVIRYATNATAQMLPLGNMLHFPSWQAKYGNQRRGIMLGGYGVDKLFAMVDPEFEGDSPRDARLLVFGGVGITGSLQRIETGASAFGDSDPVNVTGHWVGDFQCGKTRDMKAELYLKDEGSGRFRDVSGTFVFRDPIRSGEERVLSHTVAGQYLSGVGALKLEPGEWLKTVPQVGYESLGLRATAFFPGAEDAEGSARIQGDLTSKTCAEIRLARVSRLVPESIVYEVQRVPSTSDAQDISRGEANSADRGSIPASCSIPDLVGSYMTSYGYMDCEDQDGLLYCCYSRSGENCAKWISLTLSSDSQTLTGRWQYSSGNSGAAEFSMSSDCSLADGKWGYDSPTRNWSVKRTSGQP